jgi:hypothetical protein
VKAFIFSCLLLTAYRLLFTVKSSFSDILNFASGLTETILKKLEEINIQSIRNSKLLTCSKYIVSPSYLHNQVMKLSGGDLQIVYVLYFIEQFQVTMNQFITLRSSDYTKELQFKVPANT